MDTVKESCPQKKMFLKSMQYSQMHMKKFILKLKTQAKNPPTLPQIMSFKSIFEGIHPNLE